MQSRHFQIKRHNYQSQQNQIRRNFKQLNSNLNLQLPFSSLNKISTSINQQNSQIIIVKGNEQKSQSSNKNKQFLCIVSKNKRKNKRNNTIKNYKQQKKSQSVILGGQKKSISKINRLESSLMRANNQQKQNNIMCKSCLCSFQSKSKHQISSKTIADPQNTRQSHQYSNQTYKAKPNPNLKLNNHIDEGKKDLLNKFINHKLKFDNLSYPQFKKDGIKKAQSNTQKIIKRELSTGTILPPYISYLSNLKDQPLTKKQDYRLNLKYNQVQQKQNNKFRPQINKKQAKVQINKRQTKLQIRNQRKLGFISSNLKISQSIQNNIQQQVVNKVQQRITPQKINNNVDKNGIQGNIDKCFMRMTSIKKQITQLQSLLADRLQKAQYRSKSLHLTHKLQNGHKLSRKNSQERLFSHHRLDFNLPNRQNDKQFKFYYLSSGKEQQNNYKHENIKRYESSELKQQNSSYIFKKLNQPLNQNFNTPINKVKLRQNKYIQELCRNNYNSVQTQKQIFDRLTFSKSTFVQNKQNTLQSHNKEKKNKIFNVTNSKPMSLAQEVQIIRRQFGAPCRQSFR